MSENPGITGLHHVSLLVTDLQVAEDFYCRVLGLAVDDGRPEMAFPGLWLQTGAQQIHLQVLGKRSIGTAAAHAGRDAHVAMQVTHLDSVIVRLQEAGINYSLSHSGRRALFCRDPDGNGIEFVESANA